MFEADQIRHVHLEISSRCNAACPQCPRNLFGYPYNNGFTERDLTLSDAQQIFSPEFLGQLDEIYINGNFGDAVMNPDTVAIVEWFRTNNPNIDIKISTNAGARDRAFWQQLAQLDVKVIFCIDGLEDTHHLYRQNTAWKTVIKNAQIFIAAGGRAVWKMIDFDHNRHQQPAAKQLAHDMGFQSFEIKDHGRNQGPVFDKNGQLVHVMGTVAVQDLQEILRKRKNDTVLLEDITPGRKPLPISCEVKKTNSIYIDSTGHVYPCCYLGFNPAKYGKGTYHQAANSQVAGLIYSNNLLENDLATAIKWFSGVENSWQQQDFPSGRLVICNDVCGQTT